MLSQKEEFVRSFKKQAIEAKEKRDARHRKPVTGETDSSVASSIMTDPDAYGNQAYATYLEALENPELTNYDDAMAINPAFM
jgi:hypothetical protein